MESRECTYFLTGACNPAYRRFRRICLEEEQPEDVAEGEEDEDHDGDHDGHQSHHRQELRPGFSVHIDDRR